MLLYNHSKGQAVPSWVGSSLRYRGTAVLATVTHYATSRDCQGLSGSVGLHREQYRFYRVYGRGEGVRIGKQ